MLTKRLYLSLSMIFVNYVCGIGQESLLDENRKLFDLALMHQDIPGLIHTVTEDVIFMMEYQQTLRGQDQIQSYFDSIFSAYKIESIERHISETIELEDYVIDIGAFNTTIINKSEVSSFMHTGKFWHIWKKVEGAYKLFAYVQGYHKELPEDEYTLIDIGMEPVINATTEIKAYAALDEKAIREWDPEIRIAMYTDDAIFYPFADTAKVGIDILKPYLRAYHENDVQIDKIIGVPFECIYIEDYIIQFSTFEVDWRFNDLSGTNTGKGIKLWQRQADHSLKIYRQIGTHNL